MDRVVDAMTKNPITVPAEITNREAVQLLLKHNISGLFVVDEQGDLAGIITEYALLDMLYDPKMLGERVEKYMTRDVATVQESDSLIDAANTLILHRFRRLPVLADGKPVGIISRRDLLRFAFQSEANMDAYQSALTPASPLPTG